MAAEKCYMCDADATSREHVPPLCLFPKQKDFDFDFRKKLITVPSCDVHNSQKSMDDEFFMICVSSIVGNNSLALIQNKTKIRRALERKDKSFLEKIIRNGKDYEYTTKDGHVLPVILGVPDGKRLTKCFNQIVHGLYYHEVKRRLSGEMIMLFGFVEYEDKGINNLRNFIRDRFSKESSNFEKKGENDLIFYYQIIPPDADGVRLFKLTFFEGTEVFVAVIDQDAERPNTSGVDKLREAGGNIIIEYGGKEYDVT